MRFRLALAFSVSVILIGFASWSRLGTAENTQPGIVAVERLGTNEEGYQDFLQDFLEPKTLEATSPGEPLSNTDIIGRQLVMDYIELSASGKATEASLAALADRYVESIPALTQASSISYADIQTVPDTKANFQNYADKLVKIHKDYAARIGKAAAQEASFESLNPALYSFVSTFGAAYKDAALKLQGLPVPAALVKSHLQLVNKYLSSAAAMEAVSKTETDSATAFAGLIVLKRNVDEEEALRGEISRILTLNGL